MALFSDFNEPLSIKILVSCVLFLFWHQESTEYIFKVLYLAKFLDISCYDLFKAVFSELLSNVWLIPISNVDNCILP